MGCAHRMDKKTNRVVHFIIKGSTRLSEMYSALRADVPLPNGVKELIEAFGLYEDPKKTKKRIDDAWKEAIKYNYKNLGGDKNKYDLSKNNYKVADLWKMMEKDGIIAYGDEIESTHTNLALVSDLKLADRLVVAGQALSHTLN